MKNTILGIVILFFQFNSVFGQNLYAHNKPLPCVNRTFYTYVHLVQDSLGNPLLNEQELKSLFDLANKAFAPICIQFDYCKIDTIFDYSFLNIDSGDEIELITTRFQQDRRINIYITENVLSANENSFSFFNGIRHADGGIVIIPSSGIGFVHELGNLFGLLHTFDKNYGEELVDGSNCKTTGDLICDTPADPYKFFENIGKYLNKDCEFHSQKKDANDQFYLTEVGNYMSHYFCAHCFFTNEQYKKMANNYLTSTFKMW